MKVRDVVETLDQQRTAAFLHGCATRVVPIWEKGRETDTRLRRLVEASQDHLGARDSGQALADVAVAGDLDADGYTAELAAVIETVAVALEYIGHEPGSFIDRYAAAECVNHANDAGDDETAQWAHLAALTGIAVEDRPLWVSLAGEWTESPAELADMCRRLNAEPKDLQI